MTISANFPNVQPSLLLDFANAKQLPPTVTFTRATTAAYYDGSTTALADQNLLLNSQDIDNAAWTKVQSTVTANSTAAPDGTTTADTVTPNTTAGVYHYVWEAGPTISNGVQTHSIYVKANGYTKVGLREGAFSGASATFNLTTVSVISQNSTAATVSNSAITSVGNGWYRISTTYTGSNLSRLELWVLPDSYTTGDVTSFTWAGNGTSGVYLWGAQIEARSTLTAYTATTTQEVVNYIPVLLTAGGGQPRFDHNPTTNESLGLYIESQRTNTVLASEQFGNATYWGLGGGSAVTSNSIVAPNGTLTGDTLVSAASGGSASSVYQSVTGLSSGLTYTLSCYVKANGSNWVQLIATSTGGSATPTRGWFNLSTGVVGSTNNTSSSLTIASVGNGWYRCTMIVPALTSTGTTVYITCSDGNNIDGFTNNGWNGLFVWGAQVEAGSFATSYIPTTTAAATRSADLLSITGSNFSSWFNNSQGTMYSETSLQGCDTYQGVAKFSLDGATSNRFGAYSFPSPTAYGVVMSAYGTTQASFAASSTSVNTVNNFAKVIYAYQLNSFAAVRDAADVTTDTSGLVAPVNRIDIGLYDDVLNGWMRKFAYYPVRVTNAQLQALTS